MINMETKLDNICRLCLKIEGVTFLSLDEYRKAKVKAVIPELNIDDVTFVICTKCNELLEESYQLKKTVLENEKLIKARKDKLKIFDKVSLDFIFNDENNKGELSDAGNICRICLNSNDAGNMKLNDITPDNSLYRIFSTCLSDIEIDLTADPLVCEICRNKLCDIFAFKNNCLTVEEKIKQFCESDPETRNLDINKILTILRGDPEKCDGDNDFLSEFEVQDEEGADIFDNIPNILPEANVQWESEYGTFGEKHLMDRRKAWRALKLKMGKTVTKNMSVFSPLFFG